MRKMKRIGYARVSTLDQNPQLQIEALKQAGCEPIFVEQMSSQIKHRPELEKALAYLRPGEELVVWKLDRLGRNLKNLLEIVEQLRERDIVFTSLTEALSSGGAAGKLILQIFGAFAELERNQMRERTMAGLAAAARQGRKGGRPSVLSPKLRLEAEGMILAGSKPAEIIAALGLPVSSGYRLIKQMKEQPRS